MSSRIDAISDRLHERADAVRRPGRPNADEQADQLRPRPRAEKADEDEFDEELYDEELYDEEDRPEPEASRRRRIPRQPEVSERRPVRRVAEAEDVEPEDVEAEDVEPEDVEPEDDGPQDEETRKPPPRGATRSRSVSSGSPVRRRGR